MDIRGNLYVVGKTSDNVFEIAISAACSTAGTQCDITRIMDATGDGLGNVLESPSGIALGPSGSVYVAGVLSDNVFEID